MFSFRSSIFGVALVGFLVSSEAFVPPSSQSRHKTKHISSTTTEVNALWRHFIPETNRKWWEQVEQDNDRNWRSEASNTFAAFFMATAIAIAAPLGANAVSGGGLDYANLDITGQDFSGQKYKGKDFTQVIAKGTSFVNSNLQGCRFYKAYLVNTDFSGADLRGAALEDTSMDGAILKDTIAAGAYFGQSLLDVKTVENADFTDAQIPVKTLPLLCEREDVVKGTNPVTGVDTRDSLMCP
mmetsp:Transcript_27953/g.39306  ORF Transcript_27953/g.39306 Transcript_27953/m.39306 type:complete len:240 (+) Transcript_27953:174-893(+)